MFCDFSKHVHVFCLKLELMVVAFQSIDENIKLIFKLIFDIMIWYLLYYNQSAFQNLHDLMYSSIAACFETSIHTALEHTIKMISSSVPFIWR